MASALAPPSLETKASQKISASKSTRSVDDNFIFSKEMYLSLVSRIEKLETELALTKKILFKNDSQSSISSQRNSSSQSSNTQTNLVFEDSENSEEEQEEKVPPKRLLNFKKK